MRFHARRAHLKAALLALSLASPLAWAQERWLLVSPFPPGGPVDTLSRVLAEGLQKKSGLPAVVENLPGAAGNLGIDKVRKAKPDGQDAREGVDRPARRKGRDQQPALLRPGEGAEQAYR